LALLFAFCSNKPNLFIGTGGYAFGCGSNAPSAQLPFSYVRLGPDTTPLIKQAYADFQHFGGYSDYDHGVRAFSHMHLVGAGDQDMGVYGVLPKKSTTSKPSIPKDPETVFYKDS
jgi:putative alpha-1,2-mannosidase